VHKRPDVSSVGRLAHDVKYYGNNSHRVECAGASGIRPKKLTIKTGGGISKIYKHVLETVLPQDCQHRMHTTGYHHTPIQARRNQTARFCVGQL